MFSYLAPEVRVLQDHPLRSIRKMVNQVLAELPGELQALNSREGRRPAILPKKPLSALLLPGAHTQPDGSGFPLMRNQRREYGNFPSNRSQYD
jgi:hypothetical protein